MTHHCCGDCSTPGITAGSGSGCCVAQAPETSATAALPRTDVTRPVSGSPAVIVASFAAVHIPRVMPIHTSPPRSSLVDLPTLFATFLI